MIGIKDQCFGVEIELTGITREEAAKALAAYTHYNMGKKCKAIDIPL